MDNERFAGLVRAMGSSPTRRGALGIVAGLAGLSLGEVAARKKGRGNGKSKRRSQAAADKIAVCHYDADADTFGVITVNSKGWRNGHSKHEQDFLQGDGGECCDDSGCSHLDGLCHAGVCDRATGTCSQVDAGNEGGCCIDSDCPHFNDPCYSSFCDQTTGACSEEFLGGSCLS